MFTYLFVLKSASCDDPGDCTDTGVPTDGAEIGDRLDARGIGICSSGEGRPSQPVPDLGTSFPPSFTYDNPFVNGFPSGEVLLRLPRRDHIGEPSLNMNQDQTITSGEQNKEMEQLRKEFSVLSYTVQRSLEVITARLENQEPTRRDVTEQRSFMKNAAVVSRVPIQADQHAMS